MKFYKIDAYADILGYRQMLKDHSASEIYALLNDAISETHRMLEQYMNSEAVISEYRSGLFDDSNFWELFLDDKRDQLAQLREEISNSVFQLKTYIAFDTIVIYWDGFSISETNMKIFLLAIDLLYLILYGKGILIRGAIGTCDDYHIDEEGNERFFIIKNIGTAAAIEKYQNAANLIVFGKELRPCFYSIQGQGLTDDYYARLEYYQREGKLKFLEKHPDHPRMHFKNGFVDKIEDGDVDVVDDDLFERDLTNNRHCITICPINNLTFSYLGLDFYDMLFKTVQEIHDKGPGESHADLLQFNTASLLYSRLKSGIFNATKILSMWGENTETELPVERKKSILYMWEELQQRVGYKP